MARAAIRILWCSCLIALLTCLAIIGIYYWQGDRILSVPTGSMAPAFKPGDAVVTRAVLPETLRVGDIIAYRSSQNPRLIVSHRLVHIDAAQQHFTTKGDALSVADPLVLRSQIVGLVWASAPKFGAFAQRLRTPDGLAASVYVPAALVLISEASVLMRSLRLPTYRLQRR